MNGKRRIKVKRLRGIISQGLLVPAPEGSNVGDDVSELIGISHYEPPESTSTGGEAERPPSLYSPIYDMETIYKYAHVFRDTEHVICTEKIHGTSARYVFHDNRMYVGSKREWKRESPTSAYWKALKQMPNLELFCTKHPDIIVYGEVFGWVQDLRYGMKEGQVDFRVFDLYNHVDYRWLDVDDAQDVGANILPWVPVVLVTTFNLDKILSIAEGNSLINGANHIREGIIVRPLRERTHPEIGRVCLKVVSNGYLER